MRLLKSWNNPFLNISWKNKFLFQVSKLPNVYSDNHKAMEYEDNTIAIL